MAYQSIWYDTDLPSSIIDTLEDYTKKNYEEAVDESKVSNGVLNTKKRFSKNSWVSTDNWIGGFIWHYVQKANRDNFLYDLTCVDGENMQYTVYNEGCFYGWHTDSSIPNWNMPCKTINPQNYINNFINNNSEMVRKLSFVLQLSDPSDYEGGNLQLISEEDQSYFAPRKKGTIILFDSRTRHRVLKVTKGCRKSLVGWVIGPRWK